MVIARLEDTGEYAITLGEFWRYRNSKRAEWPDAPPPVDAFSDRATITAMIDAIAAAYDMPAAVILAAETSKARQYRAAAAAACRDVHGIGWQAIGDWLGYRNPRSAVDSARRRHPDLIVAVNDLIRKADL